MRLQVGFGKTGAQVKHNIYTTIGALSPKSVLTNLSSKIDRFLPGRFQFDTGHRVDFYAHTYCQSATFGPLFAFYCPLFFTRKKELTMSQFVTDAICRCDLYAALFRLMSPPPPPPSKNYAQLRTTAHNCAQLRTTAHTCAQLGTTAHNSAQLRTTSHNYAQPRTTTHNHAQPRTTTHNYAQLRTTTHNYAQLRTTTHNYAQLRTTTHNYAQLRTTTHNYAQLRTTTHNYAQLRTTTHNGRFYSFIHEISFHGSRRFIFTRSL